MLSAGESLLYVSHPLGRASPKITLGVYAHWVPRDAQIQAS